MAAAIVVIAPLSSVAVRLAGTRLTVAAGLLMIAAGFWRISQATVAWTYTSILPGMVVIGVGAALVIPSATASVMGSLPRGDTGVGSATNGVSIQVGGALGVAVIGSLLSTRYQGRMTAALASYHLPHAIENVILGSIGGAQSVAARVGGATGSLLVAPRPRGVHQRHGPGAGHRRGRGRRGGRARAGRAARPALPGRGGNG